MTNTDTQLKQALAKMLPEKLRYYASILTWRCKDLTNNTEHYLPVNDTELLHLCWLVEKNLTELEMFGSGTKQGYHDYVLDEVKEQSCIHATWQQRTIALAKVKGVEV